MPTLNNDSSVTAVRSERSRILIPIVVLLAAMALAPTDARAANSCVMITVGLPVTTNWSDTSKWTLCGGGYPGQTAAGDTASILSLLGATTINVDVPLNPVILKIDGSTPVQVASGANLTLENSSTATSSNSFTVPTGATMGTESGANITNYQGQIHVNGGTFNSLGAIQLAGGTFTFSGGSLTGSGTINLTAPAQFDGVLSPMSVSATTINDSGSLSYTAGTNVLTLSGGAIINVLSGGFFDLQTDAAINGSATESINIASGGKLRKTSGTSFNVISSFVKNDGTADASAGGTGGFGFSGNGTHTGSFITGSTLPIVFAGNHTFNAGASFSGGSQIKIAGGTQTFNSSVTASSGLKWEGGTIAGTGPLNVPAAMVFDGSVSPMTLTGVLSSTATITYAPSNISNLLTINGASAMLSATTPGSFSIAGDFDILASPAGAGKLRINSVSNVTKSSGSAGSSIYAYVDNVGGTLANTASGPLNLAGGGSSTSSISIPGAANIINFTGGTFSDSGAFSGSGTINVAGGTLNVNIATSFGSSNPNLGAISAGTLGGSGSIILLGSTTWSGGTITGSNPLTVSPASGSLTLTGANGQMTLDGRTLTNNSVLTFNSPTNSLLLANSATLSNTATFTVTSSGGTINTDGSATVVSNTSTFSKTSASGIFFLYPTFNDSGSVSISGGVLDIIGSGTSSGTFTMAAGSETWFPTPTAAPYTWASGTTFSGGKVTIDGPGIVTTVSPMTINNTILVVRGGTLATPATMTVTSPGALAWQAGTLSGAGHTVISGGTTFDMTTESSQRTASNHVIDNGGNATMVSLTQQISLNSNSSFNNTGNLDIQNDGALLTDAVGANAFNNSGNVKKSAGGSGFRFDPPYNQTAGTTDANSASSGSTIIFSAGGSMSGGTLKATQASNFVDFFNGGFTVTGGTFAGPGAIRLNGGILNINTPASFPPIFTMTSGSLGGTQSITIPSAAAFNWSGGSITGGAASPITVASGGAINANATTSTLIYDTRPLQINSGGNFNWTAGTNGITFQTGASVTDAGTFTVSPNGTLSNNSAGTFAVTGQFTYNGSGTLNVTLPLSVQTGGTVTSSGGGNISLIGPASVTHTGTFDAQAGSFITFGAGTHQLNAGSGFSAGTGTYKIAGATMNLGTNVSAPNVTLLSGSLTGTGNFNSTGIFNWSGGTIGGSGTLTVNSGAVMQLDGLASSMTLDAHPLVNNGTLSYVATSNGLTMSNGAVITNSATFNLDATPGIAIIGSGNAISNAGTLQRSVTGAEGIAASVTNTGTINANAGQLSFNAGLTQSAGATKLLGGSIASATAISLAGGTLTGNGTVFGAVNNNGAVIAPGTPALAGTITLSGPYTQAAGGSINLKIGGTSNYDIVDASSSSVSLAGTLNVTLFNAFVPAGGNTFNVLKFSARGGDFATYNLPTFSGGGSFLSSYVAGTPNLLQLTAVVTQSDLGITQSAPASVFHGASGIWTLTVTNGPTPVTNLAVTDTFANATFLSATGPCTPSGATLNCTYASLPANQSVTISLFLSPTSLATISNSASVTAAEFDPNLANNNIGPAFTTVSQAADLSLASTASINPVNAGSSLSFTLTASNAGPDPAVAPVSISNTFPSGVTAFTFSGSGWSCGPLTGGVATCSTTAGIAASGSATPLVLTMNAPGSGPAADTATVSSTTGDPSSVNNTATQSVTVTPKADLSITKLGPPSATAGTPFTYTITVTNSGPSDATAVIVNDVTPAGTTFVSNSGACATAFPCSPGTVLAGQTKTINATFTTALSFTGTSIANVATVTSSTPDPSAGNNSATAVTPFGAPTADLSILKSGPASATTGSTVTYNLTVLNSGPATATNVIVTDATPAGLSFVSTSGGCSGPFPCNLGNLLSGQSAVITATYTVTATSGSVSNIASVSGTSVDTNPGNDSSSMATSIGTTACGQLPPSLVAPANGSTISSPVTFTWTAVAGAASYKVFASAGGASTQEIGNTTSTSLTVTVGGGTVVWSVQALGVPSCNTLTSANGTFNVCSAGSAPTLSVVGTSSAGQSYTVQWTDIPGVTSYELQEASFDTFADSQTFQVTGTSKAFTRNAAAPTPFFYRVRALSACGQGPGPFSASQRVVIVPLPPISAQSPSATVDINNKHVVIQTVFIPGQGSAVAFNATTDEPWLSVSPSSGILPASGITLSVSADPADLPNGTFTATIILTFGAAGKVGAFGTTPVNVPVSISVVTPVSPAPLSTPAPNSLIIPSVGHLDGINSQWRSDVRITNTSPQKINYLLRFSPAGGDATQIKQTQVSIASNDTMALDDIVKNWYGVGALGDAANGVLEVRPLNTSGKGIPLPDDVSVSFATIASSRTFNQSAGGTLGQYIPAIAFANFIGKISDNARAGILSMQQIAQSSSYRTNLGIVEASGKPASVLVSVFDASGKNLLDLPLNLKGGEQRQLNAFLAANNITLTNGRIEVKVTDGDGKIMAYASVVDNATTDPLLVTGVPLAQPPSSTYVIPGVADLSNDLASWRTDLRIFNSGDDPQYVTLTLYPQTGSSSSDTIQRSFSINPGEVSILDNVLASRFGVTNIGGAMHVDTLTPANLVVTGRTYNQVDGGGTYGQYIAAVTPNDGVGKGGRTLNVLQVEDSTRYRTNLGIAEVSGKPVTVEVSVFLPDAKVAPKVTIPLAANEYRQFRVLQALGVGTAYNARIAIRVIDGDGKITAYGSVIDMQTQDPTYVPAQ